MRYFPLFATSSASGIAWLGFRSRYRPQGSFWATDPPPTEEEAAAWRLWMTEVFMPLNLRMESIVVEKSDLLEESEMPQALPMLCAHVAAYKTVMRRWDVHDFSEHASIINFPAQEVHGYVTDRFTQLKKEQRELLGVLQSRRRHGEEESNARSTPVT